MDGKDPKKMLEIAFYILAFLNSKAPFFCECPVLADGSSKLFFSLFCIPL